MSDLPIKRFPTARSAINPVGATAAQRRILAGIAANMAAPSVVGDAQASVQDLTEALITVKATGVGLAFDVELFWWSATAELWCKDTTFGTVAMTVGIGVMQRLVSVGSHTALALRFSAFQNPGTADAWVEGDK